MKVIILAAGMGSRLRPYTDDKPKCMVPIFGKPIIHHQIELLESAGLNDITIIGGYKHNKIEPRTRKLLVNPDFSTTNMVYTLFCAKHILKETEEDILIIYGDIIFDKEVLNKVLATKGDIVLAADRKWQKLWKLRMEDPLSDAETFKMAEENRVTELGKEPFCYEDAQAQYLGLIKISGNKLNQLAKAYENMDKNAKYDEQDFENMYMTSFIQYLIDTGWDVRAALVDNGWLEVDSASELEIYEKTLSKKNSIFNPKIQTQ